MGDSRGEGTHINADVLGRIKDRIVQLDPLPEAVFVPGDLVDSGGTDAFEFWLWFLGPIHADPPGKGIPIYPQVGNHDVWSKNANYTQPAWQNVFDLPVNGPYGYEELAYCVEIGDALFISIDTCYWDGEEYYYNYVGGEQLQWIENLLSTTDKTYKFVFGHSPAYPQTEHTSLADNRADRDAFWNLLQRHDVSAYYCGHIHSYGRWLIDTRVDARWTNPVQQVLTGSCGAPLRGRTDVLGDVYIEKFHFAVVDIDETGAHHTVIDVDGNVIDEFHIAP